MPHELFGEKGSISSIRLPSNPGSGRRKDSATSGTRPVMRTSSAEAADRPVHLDISEAPRLGLRLDTARVG
ncbi:uncharacterized protein BO80DRAFT_428635 [Aspergillus ibericus CBS 121593]|uniref:Uncharacterized protein n=1 Tax=Aspergillus ibericus CBS 121593 TaxID=1448316 RepID=A0A395GSA3_9EURO|nr:hypothetical protein BO80DRAFT_428635 [Aspergillus ibericus CBS 121593]RAK96963.1 hypothetical protein BO80DRAFT_428635 [Aspergillus ibericus CBS 121593]